MSKNYENDVVYVFGSGRKEKIESNENFGEEFFYGYLHLEKKGYKLDIIETKKQDISEINRSILKFTERLLSKLTRLTFYLSALISIQNLRKLYKSKNIVSSNHGIGMTLFVFIGIFKVFRKINFIVINSGLFAMKDTFLLARILRKIVFTLFLKTIDMIIFTNRSEYEYASKKYSNYSNKFSCIPFCIDTKFWKPEKKDINFDKKEGVLFIGNNGHRDFKLVVKIAEKLSDIPFTFITNQIKDSEIISSNVNNILGDWNAAHLSDQEVKSYYEKAKLVILPINNTLVSSGQSAGLQAASVGTTVLTTKTIGFWDYNNYIDKENIVFINSNELEEWTSAIKKIYEDKDLLKKIGNNSIELVNSEYKLNKFNKELEEHLKFND